MKLNLLILLMVLGSGGGGVVLHPATLQCRCWASRVSPSTGKPERCWKSVRPLRYCFGLVLSGALLIQSQRRLGRAEAQLQRASAAFHGSTGAEFYDMGSDPGRARCGVFFRAQGVLDTGNRWFSAKTSEGTVKAQTNAIYRKAGVNGRGQLMSLFIDDLIADFATLFGTRTKTPD